MFTGHCFGLNFDIYSSSFVFNFRRASMPMLIEEMYNSMVENLDGAQAPYCLDKVRII